MRLAIMGPPGAGKGTQASGIAEHYNIVSISTGQLFRDNIALGTPLGKRIEALIAGGDLVPDEVTNEMVFKRLEGPDVVKKGGYLLDGFPRTPEQADALDAQLEARGVQLDGVIALEANPEALVGRMLKRAQLEGRADDTEEVIRHRIDVYRAETELLIARYRAQGILIEVDAEGTVEEVRRRLTTGLDARLPVA